MKTKKVFEVGKRYTMRSACDHECKWTYEVISRTAGTIVLQQVNKDGEVYGEQARFRINNKLSEYRGAESVRPLGTYSMAPILSADSEVEVKPQTAAQEVAIADSNVMTYDAMKAKYQDAIIMVRIKDGYVTFRKDAELLNKECGVTLEHSNGIQIAAFAHSMLDVYLPRLVRNGYRIAICDGEVQPAERKRITERYC